MDMAARAKVESDDDHFINTYKGYTHVAVCRLLPSIKFNREVTPLKNCRQRRQTSNVRLPLELRSDRRETSATRVSDDLQISIFRRRKMFFRKKILIFFSVFHYFRQIFEEFGFF